MWAALALDKAQGAGTAALPLRQRASARHPWPLRRLGRASSAPEPPVNDEYGRVTRVLACSRPFRYSATAACLSRLRPKLPSCSPPSPCFPSPFSDFPRFSDFKPPPPPGTPRPGRLAATDHRTNPYRIINKLPQSCLAFVSRFPLPLAPLSSTSSASSRPDGGSIPAGPRRP